MTARLPGFHVDELNEEQAALYQTIAGGPRAGGPFALTDGEGCLRGPFNAMLLSPPVGQALQSVGAAVRYRSVLTDRAREIATLVVAAHWGSTFEQEAHEAVGRTCGLLETELAALRGGQIPELADVSERGAARTALTLAKDGRLTDEEYVEAVAVFGARGLFELTTIVGYYATLALQLRVFGGERS